LILQHEPLRLVGAERRKSLAKMARNLLSEKLQIAAAHFERIVSIDQLAARARTSASR
jgi:hypothetical protein